MTWQGWAEIALTLVLTVAIAWPLGIHLARVLEGRATPLDPLLRPVERAILALAGPQAATSQTLSLIHI